MRWSTRSAGNLNTPIRSDDRMTSWVMLSRARPRNPFRSPARIQREELGCPDVGGVAELELERRPEVMEEAQSRAVRLSFTLVPGVQDDLEARIDALGVRGQEIPKPASDFRVRSA